MLVFVEREDQVAQYGLQVGRKFWTCILFKRRECATSSFLDTLVVVENHPEQL